MNIPLNIDLQQILLHLLNFTILAVGLFFLLFRPVKRFMAERQAHYTQMEEDALQKTEAAHRLEQEYQQKLSATDAEIQKKKEAETARTEAAVRAIENEARAKARKLLADARQEGEAEKAKILEEAGRELASMVVGATEKLMGATLTQEAEAALYDRFLTDTEKGTEQNGDA